MATKRAVTKKTPATLPAKRAPDAEKPRTLAPHELVLSSNTQNAIGIMSWGKFAGVGDDDLQGLANDLGTQTKMVQDGGTQLIEGMLYRQAKTLETMFTALARRAASNDSLQAYQVNLTLALKAQAQCRSTLEALAEIKNPRPVSFVKQANISNGPQQVNNGTATASVPAHAENPSANQNGLLEANHGSETLDAGTAATTARSNQAVETLGAVHRAQNASRKGQGSKKRG